MKSLLPAALLLLVPDLALGQDLCEGRPFDATNNLAVSWDDCWYPGSTATSFKTFNCNPTPTTNVTASLHLQFKVPYEITEAITATATVDIAGAQGVAIDPFYRFDPTGCAGSGTVRGLAFSFDPGSSCTQQDGYEPFCDDLGGPCTVSSTYVLQPTPGMANMTFFVQRQVPKSLTPGSNYWLGRLEFNNRLRNNCAGCTRPTVVIFRQLAIESVGGQPIVCLTGPDSPKGPEMAGINGGSIPGPDGDGCCNPWNWYCCPTNAKSSTWGLIKTLYR